VLTYMLSKPNIAARLPVDSALSGEECLDRIPI
jgi:hypothetical protein